MLGIRGSDQNLWAKSGAVGSVAHVHPADHRAIGGADNLTLEAGVRHDRAADDAGRNADAKSAPAPAVAAPVAAAPVAAAPGRRGSGRKRNRAEGGRRGENKSHLTEHEVLLAVLDVLFIILRVGRLCRRFG